MQLELSQEDILEDIQAYQDRITLARDRLDSLPASAPTWKESKKLEDKKRVCRQEIGLVTKLISIAREALPGGVFFDSGGGSGGAG